MIERSWGKRNSWLILSPPAENPAQWRPSSGPFPDSQASSPEAVSGFSPKAEASRWPFNTWVHTDISNCSPAPQCSFLHSPLAFSVTSFSVSEKPVSVIISNTFTYLFNSTRHVKWFQNSELVSVWETNLPTRAQFMYKIIQLQNNKTTKQTRHFSGTHGRSLGGKLWAETG